jgi:hypothetical protein
MLRLLALAGPATISPGQSFNLVWAVCRDADDPPPPAATSVFVSWGVLRLFPLLGSDRGAPTTINIDRARLGAAAAVGLYRGRGPQTLSVTVALTDGRTLTSAANFRVRNDTFAFGPITFTGPSMTAASSGITSPYPGDVRLARWKTPYVVALDVRNPISATATLTLSLLEVENQRERLTNVVTNLPDGTPTPVRMTMLTLAPGETRAVSFLPFLKDWRWIQDGLWIAIDTVVRGFTYDVRFTATDEFGNFYPEAVSAAIRVEVEVSGEKISQQQAAAGTMIFAGVLAVAGLFWPPSAAAASIFVGVAAGLGAAAKDPPEPDPNFQKRVKMTMPKPPDELKGAGVEQFRVWLEAAQRIAVRRQGMFLIEAKILGAMKAKNKRGEQVQVGDYIQAVQQLSADAELLRASYAPAAKELLTKVNLEEWRSRLKAWREGRVSPDDLKGLAQTLPPELLGLLTEILKSVEEEQFNPEKLLAEITRYMGDSVSEHVRAYAAQYLEILTQRGEGISALFPENTGDN